MLVAGGTSRTFTHSNRPPGRAEWNTGRSEASEDAHQPYRGPGLLFDHFRCGDREAAFQQVRHGSHAIRMTETTTTSLSFQPWTRGSSDEGSLGDILARVNFERGHFRDITEGSLQEEIAAEGALQLSDSEENEADEEAEDAQKGQSRPTSKEELYKAKYEMLANMRAAEQEVLMSLDFVSLLLSKDAPKQALTTLSPVLKDSVPIGSLGTDSWQRTPVDKAREAQGDLLATNVRMQGLQQSADSLLAAANRLQDNVRNETEYWNQILSISDKGWNVCRVPGKQNRLGVRFGFSESSPEFSRRGVAALNASSDGSITLERGIGSKPKALHAVLRKDGKVVGSSKLPDVPDAEETQLEARIRYARDSLYDEELYHEMIRESRTLTSLGVGMKGSAIYLEPNGMGNEDIQVSLELVALDENRGFHSNSSNVEDALAQTIILAARLLLSQAHRDRLKKRSEVPPPLSDQQKDEKPVLPILRPIVSFVMHRSTLDRVNTYINSIKSILDAAKVQTSHQLALFELPERTDIINNTETLFTMLQQPWTSEAEFKISAPNSVVPTFGFKVETIPPYNFGSVFTLDIPFRSQPYRFDNFDELGAAADTKLASVLPIALGELLGTRWQCLEHEGRLVKDADIGEKNQSLWVDLDSRKQILTLNSLDKKTTWSLSGQNSSTDFWDAARDIAISR